MSLRPNIALTLAFALACGACGSEPSPSALIDLQDGSAQCANGGTLVVSGLDDNGNGILEPGEVDARRAICNGSDGQDGVNGHDGNHGMTSLLRVDDAATDRCPDGGYAVHSGKDADGSGILENDEIETTVYLCNGANGSAGMIEMRELRNLTNSVVAGISVNFAQPFVSLPPELLFTSATLALDFQDPTGTLNLTSGTLLKASVQTLTKSGFTVSVTTIDNKALNGAVVHLFYAAFEFAQ